MSATNQSTSVLDEITAELPLLLKRREVAETLRCTEAHVSRLVRRGELQAVQHRANVSGSVLLIPRAAIRAYLERACR